MFVLNRMELVFTSLYAVVLRVIRLLSLSTRTGDVIAVSVVRSSRVERY